MEEAKNEESYTLTSFEPLSPEQTKSGFFRFLEGFAKRKLTQDSDIGKVTQPGQDASRLTEDESKKTALHPIAKNFYGLPREHRKVIKPHTLRGTENKFPSRAKSGGVDPKCTVSSNPPTRNVRTPSSVLGRLSLLVLVEKTSQQQSQSDDKLKQYWMPDEQCKVCYECGVKFNTFRRRHHCRLCGQIFCSRCCNEELCGHHIGYTGVLRVCVYCKKIVLAYTSSSDIEKNIKQLKEDLSLVTQADCTTSPVSASGRTTPFNDPEVHWSYDALGVSAEEANLLKQDSFKDLWQQITAPKTGLEFQSHRIRLRTYSNCLVGRKLVDWLMVYTKASNRLKAHQICQGLLDCGWIEPLLNPREPEFKDDFLLYIPGPSATGESNSLTFRPASFFNEVQSPSNDSNNSFVERNAEVGSFSASYSQTTGTSPSELQKSKSASIIDNQEPFVIRIQNRSQSCDELFIKVDAVKKEEDKNGERKPVSSNTYSPVLEHFVYVEDCYLPKRLASQQANASPENGEANESKDEEITAEDHNLSESQKQNDEKKAFDELSSIHRRHVSSFLVQLLDRMGLSQSWKEIIEPLAFAVSETVVPDVAGHGDDMDVRQYVKIKKIPEGDKGDCRIVKGVVCTKNVVHKKMAKCITNPRILMLSCPIAFERVENRMASLDPLVLQEEEFLKNYVARIDALKPTLVLVEKTVSRLAQEMLLARGISVILNVKPKLMERISRCTEGDVLLSLDQGSRPRLGVCENFKIEKFTFKSGRTKTLAFFEGCRPRLGSTVVLRGASVAELSRVRNVLEFLIFVAYNSKLEKAFVMDEFGTPFQNENEQIARESENEETCKDGRKHETTMEESGPEGSENEKCVEGGKPEEALEQETVLAKERKNEKTGQVGEQCSEIAEVDSNSTMAKESVSDEDLCEDTAVNFESFEKILTNVILCSSPLVTYPVPYILTSQGQKCGLLSYMSDDLYWSPMFSGSSLVGQYSSDEETVDDGKECDNTNVFMKGAHPFVSAILRTNTRDLEVQELLADYRAQGGKVTLKRPSCFEQEGTIIPCERGIENTEERRQAVAVQEQDVAFHPDKRVRGQAEEKFHGTSVPMRDCFDPFLHQSIAILFSSYSNESANAPYPCISPWTLFMEFYGKNDIALGCFLEKYCFRPSYLCPSPNCEVPMVKHVRYFAHGEGAVHINMKNLESPIPGFSKTLLTWSWCKQCKQVTPVVPVSPEAWRLSFAKYLELRMYGTCYRRRHTVSPCDHSLHQDHHQYFAFNNIVASFKYVLLKIYEVSLPPSAITLLKQEREPEFWIKHIQAMSVRVHHLLNSINDRIASLKTESFISDCVSDIGHDKGQLHGKIKVLENKAMLLLSPPSTPGGDNENLLEPHEIATLEYELLDGLTLLKRKLCEFGEKWNSRLLELFQLEYEKKKSKSLEVKNSSSSVSTNQVVDESENWSHIHTDDNVFSHSHSSSVRLPVSGMSSSTSEAIAPTPSTDDREIFQSEQESLQSNDTTSCPNHAIQDILDDDELSTSENESRTETLSGLRGSSNSQKKLRKHSQLWATLSREVNSTLQRDAQLQEGRPGPKMKKFISNLLPGVAFNPIPSAFPPHEHHLLPKSELIPIVVNEKEITTIVAYTLSTIDYHKQLHGIQESMMEREGDRESFARIDLEADDACRLASQRSRTRSEAETLSSTSLMTTLDDFVDDYFQCSDSEDEDVHPKTTSVSQTQRVEGSDVKDLSTKDVRRDDEITVDGKESSAASNSSPAEDIEYHIKHSFKDTSAKFLCIVYFAEQFRRVRKAVFPDGEEKYIRSLQYCLKWRATGGKSGSSFCKTADDRFVIKEMSRPEAQSFLNIAPYYFEYIENAILEKTPTLLAKILGVYRIGYTSKSTNIPVRKDILVMDNLLYNCRVDKVFDLKGSVRSRYVMSSEKENSVLMDENLLEMIEESPLFIRPHTKAVLSRAINNDTQFLARHMVMDYSLLLGIEQDTSRLIVGIIDFIRTFTWDKKLEMYVKSTGILGGQGKMPTVVSPELYRERFCEAMQRYFLMIPNKWMALGNELK